jgi:hypothetical protein
MTIARDALGGTRTPVVNPAYIGDTTSSTASAVSWAAIFAGAAAAVATTLILLELGTGLGLSSTSAWPGVGTTAATIGIAGGLWLIFTQWIASGVGGYLAGRLRTKWVGLHSDEVFFRDTAHGFLAWSAATIISALILAMAAATVMNAGGAALGGAARRPTQQQAASPAQDPYYVDLLFRSADGTAPANGTPGVGDQTSGTSTTNPTAVTEANNAASRAEITRLLARAVDNGDLTPDDRTHLAQLVARRTGLSQPDAQKRADDVVTQIKSAEQQARDAADKARKAAASMAIITALAMVIGAFIASASAALGGRLRDEF